MLLNFESNQIINEENFFYEIKQKISENKRLKNFRIIFSGF